jgi:hypothetical protein
MTSGDPDRGSHAWTLPEEQSRSVIRQAVEAGINFFDTANGLLAIVTYGLVDRHQFAYSFQLDWSYLEQPEPRWLDRAL